MALAIARIDEEIAKHRSSIYDLSSQRNAFTPICRLPPELLSTIFIRCASAHHDDLAETNTDVPSWVNVSYVCCHWRAVALDFPTLWGYHFVLSLRWTEELLSRSHQASLKIRILFNITESRQWSLVEKLMNHTNRIQELIVCLPDHSIRRFFSMLSSPAPRLQKLKIWVDTADSEDVPSGWDSALFHGETPALRTLELSCCPVQWYSLKLSGLITLDLHDIPHRFRRNMEDFLATLSCMQNLTCLYLGRAIPGCRKFIASAACNSFQRINLPYLSRVFIDGPLSTVIVFLSCVNIPLKTNLVLECFPENDSSLDELSSSLAQRFSISEDQTLSSPIIRSLTIDFSYGEATLTFSASERNFDSTFSIVSCNSQYWGCNIPLKIKLHWHPSWTGSDADHIIGNIVFALPLTHVQSVHVLRPPFSPAIWRRMLAHLKDLRYIKLSDGFVPDLASALYFTAHVDANQDATGDRDSNHIVAPRLEELELCDIIFSSGGDPDMRTPAITQRWLFHALSARNAPQGRFTMTRCWIGNSKILDVVRSWDDVDIVGESDSDGFLALL
ncbi:hypothetical protein OG21DRAFT_1496310 [Imleria badia]|nr:hypothetical protein OG21DRAFT_1496310 [Imleria badia]